jgi:hypothetical protein
LSRVTETDVEQAVNRALQRWFREFLAHTRNAVRAGGHQLHGGNRWRPLEQDTVAQKGRMMPLTQSIARASRMSVTGIRGNLTNDHPAAVFHQTGTRHMPARPIVEVTLDDEARLTRYITEAIEAI